MCNTNNITDRIHITELYSLYAPMLTEKQRQCLTMQLDEDFSLSEIGESMGVSRQAVHDILSRTRQKLEEYEAELRLAFRMQQQRQALGQIYQDISQLATPDNGMQVDNILARLAPFTSRV